MLSKNYFLYLMLSVLIFFASCNNKKVKKVACVGDSITYGYNIKNREKNNYPVQLQHLLGEKYQVKNFGVCGATMLKKGELSYWDQPQLDSALAFQPDIVVLMLGTNDSRPPNWKPNGKERFVKDYFAMVKKFKALKSHPKIYICDPPPAFAIVWGVNDSIIKDIIIPAIDSVAYVENLRLINLYRPFINMKIHFKDNIHPDSTGAALIAKIVSKNILEK